MDKFTLTEEIKIHPETGEILRRDVRAIEIHYKGESTTIDMPGWYPADNDEGIFTQKDMETSDKALRILKARYQKSLEVNFADAALV